MTAGTVLSTSVGATDEVGEPKAPNTGSAAPLSVWFKWVAPASGNVRISTVDSSFDTVLGLYSGTAVTALRNVSVECVIPSVRLCLAVAVDEEYPYLLSLVVVLDIHSETWACACSFSRLNSTMTAFPTPT